MNTSKPISIAGFYTWLTFTVVCAFFIHQCMTNDRIEDRLLQIHNEIIIKNSYDFKKEIGYDQARGFQPSL